MVFGGSGDQGGRIAAIGNLANAHAKRSIDAHGMVVAPGFIDPQVIHDVATYEKPNQLSVGMQYVLVNGVPVIDAGKMTGTLPGKVLLGPGYVAP